MTTFSSEITVLQPAKPLTPIVEAPNECQVCNQRIQTVFVDGKTLAGPWAYMCVTCHDRYGIGLGTGHGQLFEVNEDRSYQKVWG